MQVALIIEGVFFYSLSLPEFIRVYPRVYLHGSSAGGVCAYLLLSLPRVYPREPPLDSQQRNVSSLSFLSGAGGYFFRLRQ